MLTSLREEVCAANKLLPKMGLVTLTWGNVSGIDRTSGLIVIKPSGVEYDELTPENMCVVDFSGAVVEGSYRPSSDTPTHVYLYERFENLGGIVHTHSTFATSYAQAGLALEAYGTTHADYFYGAVPCARALTGEEINGDYERETGAVIAETISDKEPLSVPGILVKNHGPFTWGKNPADAVHNALVLEEVAKMAFLCRTLAPGVAPVGQTLLDKHYFRKHGASAYYGQK